MSMPALVLSLTLAFVSSASALEATSADTDCSYSIKILPAYTDSPIESNFAKAMIADLMEKKGFVPVDESATPAVQLTLSEIHYHLEDDASSSPVSVMAELSAVDGRTKMSEGHSSTRWKRSYRKATLIAMKRALKTLPTCSRF